MGQIERLEDLNNVKNCRCIIISIILAHQPLHLNKPGAIADLPKELREDSSSLKGTVQLCGPFVTIQEGIVYLVHQLAKDFFATGKGPSIISSSQHEYDKFAYWYLDLMSNTLRKDMCDPQKLGTSAAEVHKKFSRSRCTHVGYACCYWIDHLTDTSHDEPNRLSSSNNGENFKVFLHEYLLHWLKNLEHSKEGVRGCSNIETSTTAS